MDESSSTAEQMYDEYTQQFCVSALPERTIVPPDDPIFDLNFNIWLNPPINTTNLPETTPESNIRSWTDRNTKIHNAYPLALIPHARPLCCRWYYT